VQVAFQSYDERLVTFRLTRGSLAVTTSWHALLMYGLPAHVTDCESENKKVFLTPLRAIQVR
jgi:hypothetical protein